jgi:hypothetical protein
MRTRPQEARTWSGGIYPTVATITAAGYEPVPEVEVAAAFGRVIATLSSAEVNRPAAGATGAGSSRRAKRS